MAEAVTTALVTGAARRVGRAIAQDLAENGFAVALHCNASWRQAEELAADIRRQGGRAVVLRSDLTDLTATAALIDQAGQALGRVDLLVNNASVFEPDTAERFDWEVWDRHFSVHLKAPAVLARSFAASRSEGANRLIVNLIDQRVWRLTPQHFSYTISKAALWTMTQTLAQALAPHIRVNAIGPGPTLANTRQQDEDFDAQKQALLLQKGPDLAEFGSTIRYLWSARSVTGQMIALDGGQHLAWQTPDVTGMAE